MASISWRVNDLFVSDCSYFAAAKLDYLSGSCCLGVVMMFVGTNSLICSGHEILSAQAVVRCKSNRCYREAY